MSGDIVKYTKELEPEQIYNQICDSYRAIDDFRAKLLGFLPLVSGTGIFLLLDNSSAELEYILPIGVFGFLITLGLFLYELYGIEKCTALITAGKHLESLRDEKQAGSLMNYEGQFLSRPDGLLGRTGVLGRINEPFAASIIYPAVFAAWIYVALVLMSPPLAAIVSVIVFALGFAVAYRYNDLLQESCKTESQYGANKSSDA